MLSVSSVVTVLVLANIAQISSFSITRTSSHKISNRDVSMKSQSSSNDIMSLAKKCSKVVASSFIAFNLIGNLDVSSVRADDEVAAPPAATVAPTTTSTKFDDIPKVPLYTKKGSDTQAYSDIGRGFRMLRPFGYNEFDGAGSGYAIKFASLSNVDENVVVGSTPATAGKSSITDYGTIEKLAEKLAAKRGGTVVSTDVRNTEGIIFYQFQFENPLDPSLPRTGPKTNRPTKAVELYELCVAKGRLWSVQATSNNRDFPGIHEKQFRTALASFIPKL